MSIDKEAELLKQLSQKDITSLEHSLRVTYLAMIIGTEMNMEEYELSQLKKAALFHDIGKINISKKILSKEDTLSEAEYKRIKGHPVIGYNLLPDDEDYKEIKEAILLHHERLDGSGYPTGIKKIPLFARIIGVADTFDAMTNQRPYNHPEDALMALMELRRQSIPRTDNNGIVHQLFDNKIVEIFIKAYVKDQIIAPLEEKPLKYKYVKKACE